MGKRYSTPIVKMLTIITITIVASLNMVLGIGLNRGLAVYAEFVEPKDRVFAYTVDLASAGIAPRYVSLLDRSRVAVVGIIGNVNGIAVLDVSNPYGNPVVEDVYPLTGSPTYVAKDGFPVTRIAVGSDRGEVLVLRVDGGRITKHTYIVLGADFYVGKLFLAKDGGGNVKVIALVGEGGEPSAPCLNCHVYILDEEAQGLFRIGPRVGNATALGKMYENMYVQDVAPLAIYDDTGFYWDASNVLLAYIPQKNVVRFVFNITYIQNGTAVPIPKALVEVNISRGITPMIYGVNADERGVARVPVQIDPTRMTEISFVIRDIVGEIAWIYRFVYDPARYRVLPEEIPIPPAVLSTTYVDTRPAEKVYGVPQFLRINMMLIDTTPAPSSIVEKGSATFVIDPPIHGFFFIRGAREARPKIVYGSSMGYVSIVTVAIETNRIRNMVAVEDYVGAGPVPIHEVGTYSDGRYVLVGLSDGRLRIYVPQAGGDYRLKYIYVLPSATRSIVTIPTGYGYTYVAVSSSGIQVLRSEPYPLPVFRKTLSLHISSPKYVDGDALPDLSAVALVDQSSVTVVRNTNVAVDRQIALSVDDVLAKNVVVGIVMPGNESTVDVLAVFRYPGGAVDYRLNGSTSITLKNIIPGVDYTISIYTAKPYIYNSSIKFVLRDDMTIDVIENIYADMPTRPRCCRFDIGLKYREYSIKLRVIDSLEVGKLVAPIDVYIDGVAVKEGTYDNVYNTKLLYGMHSIVVKPSKGFEDAYHTTSLEVQVDRDTEVPIVLQRKTYSVMIRILDRSTGSHPIAPINVSIFNTSYKILPERHVINITLPYGVYKSVFKPCEGYSRVYSVQEVEMEIPKVRTYTVSMSRVIYKVDITLSDIYSGSLIAPIDLYINGTLVALNTTESKVSFNIPYGNWTLTVSPSKGYSHVYEVYSRELYIDGDTVQNVAIPRTQYAVAIDLVDIYGKVTSPLSVIVQGPIVAEYDVEPPGKTLYLMLPYGVYNIIVEPANKSIYIPYTMSVEVKAPQNIKIPIQRVKYRLEVVAEDRYIGVVIGRFDLYANGTKVAENIATRATVELPYGTYSVQLVPSGLWDRGYNPSKPTTINIVGNTSIKIPVERKVYTLKIVAIEGINPVRNAVATIYSEETLTIITQLITDNNGVIETKLPYGSYRIVITHPDYNVAEIPYISLDGDKSELVSMNPTIMALLWRYMPVIATLIGLGIAIYVIMKVRAILAKRLTPEEELF